MKSNKTRTTDDRPAPYSHCLDRVCAKAMADAEGDHGGGYFYAAIAREAAEMARGLMADRRENGKPFSAELEACEDMDDDALQALCLSRINVLR